MRIYSGNIIVIGAYLSRAPIRGNTVHVYASDNIIKMKNSPLVIFAKIWSETMYYNSPWIFPKNGSEITKNFYYIFLYILM